MRHESVATLDRPQFINIQPFNPLLSKGEVKVFYIGENRNGSYIDELAANKIANTLPGSPIVGYYNEDKQDYGDHGDKIVIEDGKISFTSKTFPYGFVPTDAKVWYQNFSEEDSNGQTVIRKYLMTECVIWTGQFPESQCIINNGKGQSMEFDKETLDGEWSKINNSDKEFFIINDAIISKLCVLGEDVEPCFEGSAVTAPKVSSQFSLEDFKNTLYSMYQLLEKEIGGNKEMNEELVQTPKVVTEEVPTIVEDTPEVISTEDVVPIVEETVTVSEEEPSSEFVEKNKDKKDESQDTENDNKVESNDKSSDSSADDEKKEEEKDDEKKSYSLEEYQELADKYTALETEFNALSEEIKSLREFKLAADNDAKDNLIKSEFYMLSEDDIKDVVAKKSQYSLEELEEKLSVIAVRKKVNFNLADEEEEADDSVITYSIANDAIESATPNWIKAVKDTAKRNR